MYSQLDEEEEVEAWASFRETLRCNSVIEIPPSLPGYPSLTLDSSVSNDAEPPRQTLRLGLESSGL